MSDSAPMGMIEIIDLPREEKTEEVAATATTATA